VVFRGEPLRPEHARRLQADRIKPSAHYIEPRREIDFINPKPVVFSSINVALAKNAPHPVAAKIFIDWLLSRDGEQYLASRDGGDFCSPRSDVANNQLLCSPKLQQVLVLPSNVAQYNESIRQFKSTFGLAN
jgi:ABC-type Fe3+ transport system substrate-binding protein